MNPAPNWPRNRLLLALPSRNLKQLLSELEHVQCQREQVLVDADSSLDSIFFVDSGVVSVMAVYFDGGAIEMATIGREGCTGVQAVFGAKNSSARFFRPNPGKRGEDVACGFQSGNRVGAVLPKSYVCLRPRIPRASHGVGSMQRCP